MKKYIIIISIVVAFVINYGCGNASNNRAEKYKERLTESSERLAKLAYLEGVSASQLGNYEEAILHYNEAIKLNPNYGRAYYDRGKAKKKLGDNEGGDLDMKKGIEVGVKRAMDGLEKETEKN